MTKHYKAFAGYCGTVDVNPKDVAFQKGLQQRQIKTRELLFYPAEQEKPDALQNPLNKKHISQLRKGLADVPFCGRNKLL